MLGTFLGAVSVVGCSTNTINEGRNLSASGIAYTESVNALLDETIKQVIDFDSQELLITRIGSNPRRMLKEKNKVLSELIKEIDLFRYQMSLMQSYFVNLQSVSDSVVSEQTGESIGSISSAISRLNDLSKNNKHSGYDYTDIDEEQHRYIGTLAGMLMQANYAANIKATLKRDAPIIGTQLLLQEKQLDNILGILKARIAIGNKIYLNENVMAPYIDMDNPVDQEMWVENRRHWFRLQQVTPIFEKVQEAQKALRVSWEDILRGKKDAGAVSTMLIDIDEFVSTLHALEKAKAAKRIEQAGQID
ncbi:MAG: Unknown protein [uncultured Thiotrichaceae bacterium]|uniref:Uncharacterized protein n=1 Tax=uncultured Thiotrichaceae bacterium TaxID=298394 RepID=A0A6S6UH66_9GAMM|nr:MAG: Unknown protein [uncultured Thiotrichaceae bacterium]